MAMSWIWSLMIVISALFGAGNGRLNEVSTAALEGASTAVELCLSMAGPLCLWSGILEILRESGVSSALGRLLSPLLRRLFPRASRDPDTMAALSANVSANLLGLGNAATPSGIQAARRLARDGSGIASDELCLLVVLNTASIQLLPTTIASLRAAQGAAAPLDILPAVLLSSVLSVSAGLCAAKFFRRIWRNFL